MLHSSKSLSALLALCLLLVLQCTALADDSVFYGQNDHGVGGTIRVAVTMDGDTIKNIKTLEQKETRGLGTTAILQLTKDIVSSNSLDVDLVTGATLSSIAFTGAVRQAVEEAQGFDPAAWSEQAQVFTLSGDAPTLTNSFLAPEALTPVISGLPTAGLEGSELPAWSLTVIRIPRR